MVWLLAFVALLSVSWYLRKRKLGGNLAHGAFYASFAIPLIVVPGIALESVHIGCDELTVRTGLWFAPTVRTISLSGARAVVERRQAVQQRRASREDTYWRIEYGEGEPRSLHLPDLLTANRAAAADFLRRCGLTYTVE